jgi:ferredoxin
VLFSRGRDIHLTGHLGGFTVTALTEQGEINIVQSLAADFAHFDLILDLSVIPLLDLEVPPFGYYAPRGNRQALERALAELPDMTGEFEKAKYFHYDPSICAHANSGLQGCRRCLDVCPTGAITSLVDKIAVDPYYCQGAGSCATACPSGAIVYSFPKPADTINRLRILLRTYREHGGRDPALLFHDAEAGRERVFRLAARIPPQVIPIGIEEVGSVGMEVWLSALAFGASRVLILETEEVPDSVHKLLREQIGYARMLLEGMGYPAEALDRLGDSDDETLLKRLREGRAMPPLKPAGFAGTNEKRRSLFHAIDYLAAQAPQLQESIELPPGAPFGEIQVDRDACTLCMACVSVCPVSALYDGVDSPRLDFLEANCVQCGLCELACPEDAITRHPRFVFDQEERRRRRLLNEETPLCCVVCGKPFATRSMIGKLETKLKGHWMFQDEVALRRLRMCGECRVRDMFSDGRAVLK